MCSACTTTITVNTPSSTTRGRGDNNNDDRGGSNINGTHDTKTALKLAKALSISELENEDRRNMEGIDGENDNDDSLGQVGLEEKMNDDNNDSNEDVFEDDVPIRMAVNESSTTDQKPSTKGQRDTMTTTRVMNDDDEEEQVAVRPTFGQRLAGLFTINTPGNDSTIEKKRGPSDDNAQGTTTTTTTGDETRPEESAVRSENVPQSINGPHDMKTALELAKALSKSELEKENRRNMERIDEETYDDDDDSLGQVGIEEEKEEIRSDWNDDEDISFATNSMVARN